jgi:serine phosphatase RsbU (regulator of sigma subunit)
VAVLKVLEGSCPGQILEIPGDRCTLGRSQSSQIVLDNPSVSRTHAQILRMQDVYFLEDLRSRNGTELNDRPIQGRGRLELHPGDRIRICEIELQFLNTPGTRRESGSSHPGSKTETAGKVRANAETLVPPSAPKVPVLGDEETRSPASISSSIDIRSQPLPQLQVRPEVKLRAFLDISESLRGALEVEAMLPRVLESLFRIFPQADRGVVVLEDPETREFQIKAYQLRRDEPEIDSARISTTILREVIDNQRAILSDNAPKDPRFLSESVANLRIRSVMCVPLPCQEGLRGAIQLDSFRLGAMFSNDDLDLLAAVCVQAALALDNAQLHRSARERGGLERELELATQVQLGFLPSERPRIPGYQFADHYEPAQSVGGDFFDYLPLPDGRLAITVGDVAGKGVSAALLMARMYSDVRYMLLSQPTPAQAVTQLNRQLSGGGLGHRFITLGLAVLDPRENTVTLVTAGHLPPLLRSPRHHVRQVGIDVAGIPLGIDAEIEYRQNTLALEPGSALLLYTDGVTESMNKVRACYGAERLSRQFASARGDVEQMIETILDDIDQFSGDQPQSDDICLICLTRLPQD